MNILIFDLINIIINEGDRPWGIEIINNYEWR